MTLPALFAPPTGNAAMDRWVRAVNERLQASEAAGSGAASAASAAVSSAPGGVMVQTGNGGTGYMPFDAFVESIRRSRLYQDLIKRLDDPSRFDDLPEKVRAVLLNDIAAEAKKRGADVQHLEYKVQSATESLAISVDEVTAAIFDPDYPNSAGAREVTFASATEFAAQTGVITQLQADTEAGLAALEVQATATSDLVDGLRGQYTVKVNAGNAMAGFGLAAEETTAGATTSSFLVQADKFAVMPAINFSQEATPSATAAGQIWYKPSTSTYYRSTSTGTANWTVVSIQIPFGVDAASGTTYINGNVRIGANGDPLSSIHPGMDGADGAPGATVALAPAKPLVIPFDAAGNRITESDGYIYIDASTYNITTPVLKFFVDGVQITATSGNVHTVNNAATPTRLIYWKPSATYATLPDVIKVEAYSDGVKVAEDYTSVIGTRIGAGGVGISMPNSTHALPTTTAGVVTYTNSGTTFQIYEGGTALTFFASGSAYPTTKGAYQASVSGTSITPGAVSGTGTTTGTIADHSAMTADSAKVTVTFKVYTLAGDYVTVSADQTLAKAQQGSNGDPGARGSVTAYASGSSWSDTTANTAIQSATGGAPVIGDTVTISNSTFAATRYWGGSAWIDPGVVINGSLLVTGTVHANKIQAGTITADRIVARGVTSTASSFTKTQKEIGTNAARPFKYTQDTDPVSGMVNGDLCHRPSTKLIRMYNGTLGSWGAYSSYAEADYAQIATLGVTISADKQEILVMASMTIAGAHKKMSGETTTMTYDSTDWTFNAIDSEVYFKFVLDGATSYVSNDPVLRIAAPASSDDSVTCAYVYATAVAAGTYTLRLMARIAPTSAPLQQAYQRCAVRDITLTCMETKR